MLEGVYQVYCDCCFKPLVLSLPMSAWFAKTTAIAHNVIAAHRAGWLAEMRWCTVPAYLGDTAHESQGYQMLYLCPDCRARDVEFRVEEKPLNRWQKAATTRLVKAIASLKENEQRYPWTKPQIQHVEAPATEQRANEV